MNNMTPTGILPSYQRFVNGVPVPNFSRRSFRQKERCLIVLVFVTFGVVCFGGFFFLPEFRGVDRVYKVYQHMQRAGPELLIPAPPHGHGLPGQDFHLLDDRAKLLEKINQDQDLKVLERPALQSPEAEALQDPSLGEIGAVNGISQPPLSASEEAPVPPIADGEDADPSTRLRRDKVKEMMKHAWEGYKLYAWGRNEVRPISKRGHSASIFGTADLGATIVDALDTLYIMGMHKEFKEGRDWVASSFSLEGLNSDLSVFETNIRFVAGFLSCYAFTGDKMFLNKAQNVADRLLPAFQTPTGIPHALVNLKTGNSKNYAWASGGSSILSEFGTLHLEFMYLSDVTGNSVYRDRVQHIRQVIRQLDKPKGLYPNYLNPKTGKWGQHHMSLGALGDSFFEYLLKAWLQSGREDQEARQMYDDAMAAITTSMIRTSPGGLTYVSDLKFDRLEHKMDHLACFSGGLYGLGAHTMQNTVSAQYMKIADGLTTTCHESYDRTATKLGPESFRFTESVEAKAIKSGEKYYILRPETIESYFIMWRLTKDQKYRDWGWEVVQALEKHCRVAGGYSGIKNVYVEDSAKDDVQQSYFLAETLKYLYLLFSDDSLVSLDEWVFNTEAHPLPIRGVNQLYRAQE